MLQGTQANYHPELWLIIQCLVQEDSMTNNQPKVGNKELEDDEGGLKLCRPKETYMVMFDAYKNILSSTYQWWECVLDTEARQAGAKLLGNVIDDESARDWIWLRGPS